MPNRSKMSYVRATVENEGFDYAFRSYSDFEDIKDEEFHELRKAYVEAANALAEYTGCDEEHEEDDPNEDDPNEED